MGRSNFNFWAFTSATALSSLYLLFLYLPGPASGDWLNVLFFALLIFSLASLKRLLSIEDSFSFEYIVIVLSVLTHGFGALWPVAIAAAGDVAVKKKPVTDVIYFASSTVIATWCAAAIFTVAGGTFTQLDITRDYIPLLCFLSTLLISVFGFRAIFESLLNDRPLEILHFLKDESSTTLLILVTGIIGTILYQRFGLIGLGILMLLTIGIWKTIKVYLHSEQKYVNTVGAFLAITENKIPHFRGHSERVARYSQMILSRMRVSREDKCVIEYAALLHDIGKAGMPETLLRINRYLTSEEVQTLEKHSEIGQRLVKQIKGMEKVADLIYCHHERYDGQGYPRFLSGRDIPLGARVVAAADIFDNLLNRVGLKFEQACTQFKSMAGAELDPEIVDILLQAVLEENPGSAESDTRAVRESLEEGTRDIVEQLRYYLDKSWVLGTLHVAHIVLWKNGQLKNLGQGAISESIKDYLAEYASKCRDVGICCKEFVIDSSSAKVFNAYFVKVSEESCMIIVFDLTDVLKTERDREDREKQIYRDVISAVTQGKLLLAFGDEIKGYTGEGEVLSELRLKDPADVAAARAAVRDVTKDMPLPGKRKTKLVLCVSEAVTNVIKHVGEGHMSVQALPGLLRIVISDNGPGIDISQIPQVTLHKGYSTKISLGYGFTVMLDYLDRLVMSVKNGTILVLEMNFDGERTAEQILGRKEVAGEYVC